MPDKFQLKVWWIPQIPMKAFEYEVNEMLSARSLLDALAKYDLFQYENNIKPDYANAGGCAFWNGEEWEDIDLESDEDIDYYLNLLMDDMCDES